MKYDFDEIINRENTNSDNVEGFRAYMFKNDPTLKFPVEDKDIIRMWVADMDFAVAPEIRDAIKERVDKGIFGYTSVYGSSYYDAFSKWCKDRYDWIFPQEELMFSPGIIPALYELAGDIVEPGEKLMFLSPAYGYFKKAADYNGLGYVCSPAVKKDGNFVIDFEDFEKKAKDPGMKLVIWCNPHNPTGRIWTEEELERIARIVTENDLWIISDEIHCDLLRSSKTHTPMGKITRDYKKLVTCMSASKTFNMAGMMFSNIIIRDGELRKKFLKNDKLGGAVNPLSLAASTAAYEKGWHWLTELRKYLDENFLYAVNYISKNIPRAVCSVPDATYLLWVDLGDVLGDVGDLPRFFAEKAGVLVEGEDRFFVDNARGFIRLNLAIPRALVEKGLERMVEAVRKCR